MDLVQSLGLGFSILLSFGFPLFMTWLVVHGNFARCFCIHMSFAQAVWFAALLCMGFVGSAGYLGANHPDVLIGTFNAGCLIDNLYFVVTGTWYTTTVILQWFRE